jgi:hypothetical protein
MDTTPANFGSPAPFTNFSQPGGEGPGQIWDTARPSQPYHGRSPLFMTGGSLRAEGKGPFDETRSQCSNDGFWNDTANRHSQAPYPYGPGSQAGK